MAEPPVAGYGHRVHLGKRKDDVHPAGLWRCLDASPTAGHWWVQPVDEEARAWLAAPDCPLRLLQGCVEWPSRLMTPPAAAALF